MILNPDQAWVNETRKLVKEQICEFYPPQNLFELVPGPAGAFASLVGLDSNSQATYAKDLLHHLDQPDIRESFSTLAVSFEKMPDDAGWHFVLHGAKVHHVQDL